MLYLVLVWLAYYSQYLELINHTTNPNTYQPTLKPKSTNWGFFMARQPRTPGATIEAPKATETEVVTKTTADQADAALNAILGTPDSKDAETTESTSTPSEPVHEAPATKEQQDKQEYEEFLEWKKNRAGAATQPVAQHVPASSVGSEPVTKRTRQVLTDKGWDSEEY